MHRRPARGFLEWLRGSQEDSSGTPAPSEADIPASLRALDTLDPMRLARAQLLHDIGEFLLAHDLDITNFTLAVAHDYLTGSDGHMMRQIDERIHERAPVTLEWLEQASRERQPDEHAELNRLMVRLENNMEEFGRTTNAAKSAASDYSSALTDHVDDLGAAGKTSIRAQDGQAVNELMGLARAMLERTRSLEQEMARGMLQTRALRRSLEQARRSAEEDHLTGLPNRRAFEKRYAAEYASARECGEQLCVAFCDIDNFKRINDQHGHDAGDRVLKAVAECLARLSNDRCHVARHGGEEFVVLLRGRSPHQAWELLDDARASIAERQMVNRATDAPFGRVTFSGGVADVFGFANPRAALSAADKALYRAKGEGRDRVIVAPNEIPPTRP
ncbi:MAG TPA: GGDEF domain-containing protein [Novosphingobium sp.]|nr:GGDEF domain-containing protein [Novosphingobium sp.]